MITEGDFPELHRQISGYVFARIPHPDAEDVVGEVLLALCKSDFRGESSLSTFQFSIMRRKVADWIREKHKRRELEKHAISTHEKISLPDFEYLYDEQQVMERFWAGAHILTERQKQVIDMYYDEGMTLNDIAGVLGISLSMATTHKSSGVRHMFRSYVRRTNAIRNDKGHNSSTEGGRPHKKK